MLELEVLAEMKVLISVIFAAAAAAAADRLVCETSLPLRNTAALCDSEALSDAR